MSFNSGFNYDDFECGELSTVFQFFWNNRLFTDVEFIVEDEDSTKTFYAHKTLLAIWSPVFADKFFKQESSTNNVIDMKSANPLAFESLLRFIYGYDLNLNRESVNFVCEVHKLATAYEIEALQCQCKSLICVSEVKNHNVFELLEAAEYLGARSLKARCLEAIANNTSGILECYNSSMISRSMVYTILNAGRLSLSSEYELFEWVLNWVMEEYKSSDAYSNLKEVLEEFLPLLNITSLTCKEFAALFKKYEYLFNQSEGLSIFMNIAKPGSWPMPSWYSPGKIVERAYGKAL